MAKSIGVYVRVSSTRQDTRSQVPDLKRWVAAQGKPARWFTDKFTGRTMARPEWDKLQAAIDRGEIDTLLVWRIDRLGRTAKGLASLFADLQERKVNLVSLRDGLDLSTPAGRLMGHILGSIAQYEGEVRLERILAGQAAARAAGKSIGGGVVGRRVKVSREVERTVKQLYAKGEKIAAIARVVGLSRPTVYAALAR
jgi:DNA invertase Pin-like site-specific DNA recombinase